MINIKVKNKILKNNKNFHLIAHNKKNINI